MIVLQEPLSISDKECKFKQGLGACYFISCVNGPREGLPSPSPPLPAPPRPAPSRKNCCQGDGALCPRTCGQQAVAETGQLGGRASVGGGGQDLHSEKIRPLGPLGLYIWVLAPPAGRSPQNCPVPSETVCQPATRMESQGRKQRNTPGHKLPGFPPREFHPLGPSLTAAGYGGGVGFGNQVGSSRHF